MRAGLSTGLSVSLMNPLVQVVPSIRKVIKVPAVGEEVIIEKSRPTSLQHMEEVSTGCIVDSDSEGETTITTSLARKFPTTAKRACIVAIQCS